MLSIWVLQLSHVPILYNQPLKKHPTYAKSSAFLQQNYCVRSYSVIYFLLLFSLFVTTKRQTDENLQIRNKNQQIVVTFDEFYQSLDPESNKLSEWIQEK